MLYVLIAGLLVWMFGCGYAGYHKRVFLFLIVLVTGMTLNTVWMVLGLDARPLSRPALTAHMAAFVYGVTAFVGGWFVGRIVRSFRESRVDGS